MYTHLHAHACMQATYLPSYLPTDLTPFMPACIHAPYIMHAYGYGRIRTCTCMHTYASCWPLYTHSYVQILTGTYIQTYIHTHTHTHVHRYRRTHTSTYASTYAYTCACIHTYMYAHTHIHKHKHMHIHIHTCMRTYRPPDMSTCLHAQVHIYILADRLARLLTFLHLNSETSKHLYMCTCKHLHARALLLKASVLL